MKPGTRTEGAASLKVSYSQAVPVHLRGKVRELSGVLVDSASRGHGAASALLATVITEADLNRMALLVVVEPFGDTPLNETALAAWYERHGFKTIQDTPPVMVRPAR
jgi:GNAT superfamily N-acetyltransferase